MRIKTKIGQEVAFLQTFITHFMLDFLFDFEKVFWLIDMLNNGYNQRKTLILLRKIK